VDLEKDGFLSADIGEWIALNRQAHSRWFAVAHGLNQIAQKHFLDLSVDGDDLQSILVALLFTRGVTNFQGAIVLVERGITVGARILVRSCFEDVFYLIAIHSSKDYHQQLIHADQMARKRIARALLKMQPEYGGLDQPDIEKLNSFLSGLPEDLAGSPASIAKAASDAGLTDVYDTYYRGLSNDAAHPSLVTLGCHFDDDNHKFLWGPEPERVLETISAACTAMLYLISGFRGQFDASPEGQDDPEFQALFDEYRALIKVMAQEIRGQS
jgi:hypothetical protein